MSKKIINGYNFLILWTDTRHLEAVLNKNFKEYDIINTPRFITTNEELEQYEGSLIQITFYSRIRKKTIIVMVLDQLDEN